jgi:RNA recognition motif-containing protein
MGGLVLLACLGLASPAMASKKLFVGGLAWGTPSQRIEQQLSRYGPILSTTVIGVDRDGERSAEAIVEFEHEEDADAAAQDLDGTVVAGRG